MNHYIYFRGMKYLIVAATQAELRPFFEHHRLEEQAFSQTRHMDILITGVGMVATSFALGQHLKSEDYRFILNVGIAGSFTVSFPPGTLVQVTEDLFSELGAEDGDRFISLSELGFGESLFRATPPDGLTALELPLVKGITVNRVHGREDSILTTLQQASPEVESMEGAAVFYAANRLKIPCLQIRCISNFVEKRDRSKWQIDLAIRTLNQWLIDFVASR